MVTMMNQQGFSPPIFFRPSLTPSSIGACLAGLLLPGDIMDSPLARHCSRLEGLFRSFVSTCPSPQWAPGLVVTAEMRRQYEIYLPMVEIEKAIHCLCRKACLYDPCFSATDLASTLSWPETLGRLYPLKVSFNPSRLIEQLASSQEYRNAFLAALFIPKSFGGGFRRYPVQAEFLRDWLDRHKKRLSGRVKVLDAACGSGEGTYDVAEMLVQLGFSAGDALVEGSTLEPLELVAAAHGWFPHDRLRSAAFRERVGPLIARGGGMIRFLQEDLCSPLAGSKKFDVILCNGLLGGPLLNGKGALSEVICRLAARLSPGGILLAADHFHEGWQKRTPPADIKNLLAASGLEAIDVVEGVGAVRIE